MSLLLAFTPAIAGVHDTSGVLIGPGSDVIGSADHVTSHVTFTATGALIGQGAVVVGSALHSAQFSTSGDLNGNISIVNGVATRISTSPDPAYVLAGIQYGPGFSLTGTLVLPAGETVVGLRSFTGRF